MDDLIIGTAVWDNCVIRQLELIPESNYNRVLGEHISFHIGRAEDGWQGCLKEKGKNMILYLPQIKKISIIAYLGADNNYITHNYKIELSLNIKINFLEGVFD